MRLIWRIMPKYLFSCQHHLSIKLVFISILTRICHPSSDKVPLRELWNQHPRNLGRVLPFCELEYTQIDLGPGSGPFRGP